METSIVKTNVDTSISNVLSTAKYDRQNLEANEKNDQVKESREKQPEISEVGLRLSAGFQNSDSQSSPNRIENPEQAQKAVNDLNLAIQNSADQTSAAHSNLTSNVVKSILG